MSLAEFVTSLCADGRVAVPAPGDVSMAAVGFNRGGYVIAATSGRLQVYDTKDGQLSFVGETSRSAADPVAVFATGHDKRFGVVSAHGAVTVYEI